VRSSNPYFEAIGACKWTNQVIKNWRPLPIAMTMARYLLVGI